LQEAPRLVPDLTPSRISSRFVDFTVPVCPAVTDAGCQSPSTRMKNLPRGRRHSIVVVKPELASSTAEGVFTELAIGTESADCLTASLLLSDSLES